MPEPSAAAQLKSHTDVLHRQLDSCSRMTALMSPSLSVSAYAEILRRMTVAWSVCSLPLQRLIETGDFRPPWLDPELLEIGSLAEQDLMNLKLAAGQRDECPNVDLNLDPHDLSAMAGLCYVMSGSRRGARVIVDQLLRHPDPMIRGATGHFQRAARPGLPWILITRALNASLTTSVQIATACSAASLAFSVWLKAMDSHS